MGKVLFRMTMERMFTVCARLIEHCSIVREYDSSQIYTKGEDEEVVITPEPSDRAIIVGMKDQLQDKLGVDIRIMPNEDQL